MYVALTDGGTDAMLYWGDPGGGFDSVTLDTTLASVDDIDVHVTVDDIVVVAVRGDDDIVIAFVSAP